MTTHLVLLGIRQRLQLTEVIPMKDDGYTPDYVFVRGEMLGLAKRADGHAYSQKLAAARRNAISLSGSENIEEMRDAIDWLRRELGLPQ
jgi:hypothetical protein